MADSVPHILVVEDERNVGLTLVERLRKEGMEVAWSRTGAEAEIEIGRRRFDLALLDVGLPDKTGFEVATVLRSKEPSTAIIFLTAFGNPEDRIRGLELGAEDYVVKPFHLRELLLRIQNGLRRANHLSRGSSRVTIGRATVDFSRFEATVDGKAQSLTHKESALLRLLVDRSGKVVSRDEILDHVWSADEFPTSRTVDNFIMRIRRLVEANPEHPQVIKSVRGVGYLHESL
jgi:DNA-binding response OmpR family regulator